MRNAIQIGSDHACHLGCGATVYWRDELCANGTVWRRQLRDARGGEHAYQCPALDARVAVYHAASIADLECQPVQPKAVAPTERRPAPPTRAPAPRWPNRVAPRVGQPVGQPVGPPAPLFDGVEF